MFLSECKDSRLDLAVVLDMSEGLSSTQIQQLLNLVQDIVQALQTDIDNGNIKIAFIVFTDEVFVEFQLTDYQTSAAMITHINNVPERTGGTRTGIAWYTRYL